MMKIGIGIGDIAGAPAGADGLIAQAKRAEADGFASGWFANIMGMDAIMAAALCARETKRIELGTAVMPTFPRHPHAMAQQALSAQAIAGGRFTLGIGLSHQIVIEGMLGLSFAKPYSHMKEYLAVLGQVLLHEMYEAFGRGDIPAILDRLDENVEWDTQYDSPAAPWLEPRRGRQNIAGFFEALAPLQFTKFEPHTMAADG